MCTSNVLLHLSLIPHVGPATVLKIIRTLEQQAVLGKTQPVDILYKHKARDLIKLLGLSPRIANIIAAGLADKKNIDEELELIEKYNITVATFLDDHYPESLKQIHYPPLVLYSKGKALRQGKALHQAHRIAIVGSRKADNYAKSCIQKLVPALVDGGWEIVSGGAAGVDTMAHRETIVAGGTTIAVFGAGLTQPYPTSNKELFRKIVRNGGTLISPFPLKTTPHKGNFPARNRIIAGLSQGCVIVQAASKSGALITADFALNQGRQVFALPGKINNELSAGCHKLIQQGAKLVTDINDILEEFGQIAVQPHTTVKQKSGKPNPILQHLTEPTSLDELSMKININSQELLNQLFMLQLEGKIKQNFAGLWQTLQL